MSDRHPNRLIHEASPYLLQHAYNPVDWYPWSDEALERSRAEDRPILLSIGYSSCHWCHVMERESFESEAIADLLNKHFVSIKVDREERPDIDDVYMTAVQAMNQGQGGWPLTVFLTPDLQPFFGRTYMPPESRPGMLGLRDAVTRVAELYKSDRKSIEESARQVTDVLRQSEQTVAEGQGDIPGDEVTGEVLRYTARSFDHQFGGFGPAPKFPRPVDLSLLLRIYEQRHIPGDDRALDDTLQQCILTLDAMAYGGIYDQIGGGFHRYSTDRQWLVPHFEKMLYDNALLARTYTEAFQLTQRPLYRRIACEVLDYLEREMTSAEGGFFSATDADSEGEEGKFFVWTPAEVEALLGDDAGLFCAYFNVTGPGNFERGTSIPHVRRSADEVAGAAGRTRDELEAVIQRGREKLYAERDKRPKPLRDEKIITAWNALAITAFAMAARAFDVSRYRDIATRAADFLLDRMMVGMVGTAGNRLHRIHKEGKTRFPGYLDDHAYLAAALLDVYELTFDEAYFEGACELVDVILTEFAAPGGGLYFTGSFHAELITRKQNFTDSATPSGMGVAAQTLLRLARLTGDAKYRDRAESVLKSASAVLSRWPMACASLVTALEMHLHPGLEVALVGSEGDAKFEQMVCQIHQRFAPRDVVAATVIPGGAAAPHRDSDRDAGREPAVPLLCGRSLVDGGAAAYLCRDFACQRPITNPDELAAALKS